MGLVSRGLGRKSAFLDAADAVRAPLDEETVFTFSFGLGWLVTSIADRGRLKNPYPIDKIGQLFYSVLVFVNNRNLS